MIWSLKRWEIKLRVNGWFRTRGFRAPFGMMNLVFGILLLLMGAGYLAIYIVMPTFQKQTVAKVQEQQEIQKRNREAKLADLKKQEAVAKAKEDAAKNKEETEKAQEERTTIVEERQTLERQVEPDFSAMTDLMGWNVMSDIRLAFYYFSEIILGMVLNVLMAIAGVGLLGLAEWGRRLAIGVAWLKVLRWVGMITVTLVFILPITVKKVDKAFTQLQNQANAKAGGGAAGIPMVGMAQVTAIFGAVAVVFSAMVACIYPAISLWFLTRPPTRAACLQGSKPAVAESSLDPGDAL